MKKRIVPLALALLLLLSLSVDAFAATQANNISPSLSFSGTTAYCKLTVYDPGKAIEATLELWRGSTLAASWTSSGTSRVTINESCGVISGQTYTLKAHGAIGGAEFETTPISGQC